MKSHLVEELLKRQKKMEEQLLTLQLNYESEVLKNQLYRKKMIECQAILGNYLISCGFLQDINIFDFKKRLFEYRFPVVNTADKKSVVWIFLKTFIWNNLLAFPYSFLKNKQEEEFDLACIIRMTPSYENSYLIAQSRLKNIPVVLNEAGFIESIVPPADKVSDLKFRLRHSLIFDTKGFYYHAGYPSSLEDLLNSDFEISPKEMSRAKLLMDKIRRYKISKYNHQPIQDVQIGDKRKEKVLVIDQTIGDQSIVYGKFSDAGFQLMLDAAIHENPNADIIVKTHPDNLITKHGHFSSLNPVPPVYKIDFEINPISLLEKMDKVYTCSSTMGFEALICGKEVHVFGMPFYAGWGVTYDRQNCHRRIKQRSVEEIFYAAYIMYPVYGSYKTNQICEIEQTIDELLELREEFWNS